MSGIRYTLLGDGPSDRLLDNPIRWLLRRMDVPVEIAQWADLSRARPTPRCLQGRIQAAVELYPAQLFLIHRDAEGGTREERIQEIQQAAREVVQPHVAVVPIRMTEAWFLHDEAAIRRASGNPNGTIRLTLPQPLNVERDADPKRTLREALIEASELTGRRRAKKAREFGAMRARVAELIEDFGPLAAAQAFSDFQEDLEAALCMLGYLEAS